MNKTIILIMFFFLIIITPVSSEPPFQQPQQELNTFLYLESSYPEYHKLNEDYYIHIHIYNSSDGRLINDSSVNCYYHFYNNQMKGGEHIDTGTLSQYVAGFYNYTNGSLINQTGEYSVLIWCDYNNSVGGFTKNTFTANTTGEEPINSFIPIALIIGLVGMIAILIYFTNSLDESHFIFKLLTYSFIPILFILIANIGMLISQNYSFYDASARFFKITLWFIYIYYIYFFIYLFYTIFKHATKVK